LAASAFNGLSFSRPARPVTSATQTYLNPTINIMGDGDPRAIDGQVRVEME